MLAEPVRQDKEVHLLLQHSLQMVAVQVQVQHQHQLRLVLHVQPHQLIQSLQLVMSMRRIKLPLLMKQFQSKGLCRCSHQIQLHVQANVDVNGVS